MASLSSGSGFMSDPRLRGGLNNMLGRRQGMGGQGVSQPGMDANASQQYASRLQGMQTGQNALAQRMQSPQTRGQQLQSFIRNRGTEQPAGMQPPARPQPPGGGMASGGYGRPGGPPPESTKYAGGYYPGTGGASPPRLKETPTTASPNPGGWSTTQPVDPKPMLNTTAKPPQSNPYQQVQSSRKTYLG